MSDYLDRLIARSLNLTGTVLVRPRLRSLFEPPPEMGPSAQWHFFPEGEYQEADHPIEQSLPAVPMARTSDAIACKSVDAQSYMCEGSSCQTPLGTGATQAQSQSIRDLELAKIATPTTSREAQGPAQRREAGVQYPSHGMAPKDNPSGEADAPSSPSQKGPDPITAYSNQDQYQQDQCRPGPEPIVAAQPEISSEAQEVHRSAIDTSFPCGDKVSPIRSPSFEVEKPGSPDHKKAGALAPVAGGKSGEVAFQRSLEGTGRDRLYATSEEAISVDTAERVSPKIADIHLRPPPNRAMEEVPPPTREMQYYGEKTDPSVVVVGDRTTGPGIDTARLGRQVRHGLATKATAAQPVTSRRSGQTVPADIRPAEAGPTIRVTIGRVDVRSAAPAHKPIQRASQPKPALSLNEYLRRRKGGHL